jgi:hypothetical protein
MPSASPPAPDDCVMIRVEDVDVSAAYYANHRSKSTTTSTTSQTGNVQTKTEITASTRAM